MVSSIVLIASLVFAQKNEQSFIVPDYNGGLNVKSDTADLKPNEAIQMDNLVFNKYGALEKRQGIKYWNKYPLTTGQVVKDIQYFDNQTLIATQNWIYAEKGYNDTVSSTVAWGSHRIGYSEGTVHVVHDSDIVYGLNTWWLLAIKKGDYIEISDTTFVIDSILTDSSLLLNKEYTLTTDTLPYQVYRYLPTSTTQMTSWDNNLYVANDIVPPFYYDSLNCRWLACVDSGTLDTILHNTTPETLDIPEGSIRIYYEEVNGENLLANRIVLTNQDSLADSINALLLNNRLVFLRHLWTSIPGEVPHHYVIRQLDMLDSVNIGTNYKAFYIEGDFNWTPYPYYPFVDYGCKICVGWSANDSLFIQIGRAHV
jgi:hypothetical protein